MRPRWVLVAFLEALLVALAEAAVAALGWLLRRAWRRFIAKKKPDEEPPA